MDHLLAFIRAIRQDPKHESNWLVFADWCEEQGHPDVARRLRAKDGADFALPRKDYATEYATEEHRRRVNLARIREFVRFGEQSRWRGQAAGDWGAASTENMVIAETLAEARHSYTLLTGDPRRKLVCLMNPEDAAMTGMSKEIHDYWRMSYVPSTITRSLNAVFGLPDVYRNVEPVIVEAVAARDGLERHYVKRRGSAIVVAKDEWQFALDTGVRRTEHVLLIEGIISPLALAANRS